MVMVLKCFKMMQAARKMMSYYAETAALRFADDLVVVIILQAKVFCASPELMMWICLSYGVLQRA